MATYRRNASKLPDLLPIEERLEQRLRAVNIIGELDIDKDLHDTLREVFAMRLRMDQLQRYARRYPACFAVHLVAEGIYGYEGGNYWGGTPLDQYGSRSDQTEAGKRFETIVENYGLESFPGRKRRYVDLIMLHTALPSSELSSFFEHAVYPTVHDSDRYNAEPRELVKNAWVSRPPGKYKLNQGVKNFLQQGGEVPVDFAARCLSMAREATQEGHVPDVDTVRLPERVVRAYEAWWRDYRQRSTVRSTSAKARAKPALQEPIIWFDPGTSMVMADLPAQTLSALQGDQAPSAYWTLELEGRPDEAPIRVDVHTYRTADGWRSESEQVALELPARAYTIQWHQGKHTQTWELPGLAPNRPLMTFDAEELESLGLVDALPAQSLWFLYPTQHALSVPEGHQIEADRTLHDEWNEYQVACWSLSGAAHVQLNGASETTWPVVEQGQGMRPQIIGGDTLPVGGKQDTYYSALPTLRIPVPPQRDVSDEAGQWQVKVEEAGSSSVMHALGDLLFEANRERHVIQIPLDQVVSHIGTYKVGLRGPLGRSKTFSFTYTGGAQLQYVDSHPRLPDIEGRYKSGVVLLTRGDGLHSEAPEDGLRIESPAGHVERLVLAEDQLRSTVRLIDDTSGGSVDIPVVVPGIHWALRGESGMQSWATRPLRYAIEELDQTLESELIVRLNPSGRRFSLDGTLTAYAGETPVQELQSTSRARHQLRFNLLELRDRVQATAKPLELRLRVGDQTIPVVRLTPSLHVQALSVAARKLDDQWNVDLSWETGSRSVTNRRIYLWPLGRPWEDPHSIDIPDRVDHHHRALIPLDELAPGRYLAELVLVDPWNPRPPQRPASDAANVASVRVGSMGAELKHGWEDTRSAAAHLERALLCDSSSETSQHLHKTTQRLDPSSMDMVIRTLWQIRHHASAMNHVGQLDQVYDELRRYVYEHPEAAAKALRNERFAGATKQDKAHFLVQIGLPAKLTPASDFGEAARHVAWELWDTLGWMVSTRALLENDPETLRRAQRFIGIASLRLADPGSHSTDAAPPLRPDETWLSIAELSEHKIGTVSRSSDVPIQLPVRILQQQQEALNASLRGYFDDDKSWLAVNYDWLVQAKRRDERRRVLKQLHDYKGPLRAGIERLTEHHTSNVAALAQAYRTRYLAKPDNTLQQVPFLVGATALLQRMHAAGHVRLQIFEDPADLIECGRLAHAGSRALYERDLCLVSLSLRQQSSA